MTSTINATSKKLKVEELFSGRPFFYGVGRRKSAIAKVRLFTEGKARIYINDKEFRKYFAYFEHQKIITRPLDLVREKQNIDMHISVVGGGMRSQSDAIALGAARAIVKFNVEYKERLRASGLLTRDARVKERKKPGLKRARRAPQWQKR